MRLAIGATLSALAVVGIVSLSAPATAQSVMKQCGDDWKTAKAAGTTNGQTWKDFLKTCKTQKEAATPAATPVPAPTPTPAIVKPIPVATTVPMAPKPAPTPMKPKAAATGAGEFTTEAEAKGKCPSDTVVWVNTKSHKYHFAGHRSYGTTKQGAYMCQADANAAGDVASKGEAPK